MASAASKVSDGTLVWIRVDATKFTTHIELCNP